MLYLRLETPTGKPLLTPWLLVDADMIKDADRFKMDLIGGLERTLQGQVKPSLQPLLVFLPAADQT